MAGEIACASAGVRVCVSLVVEIGVGRTPNGSFPA